MDHFDAVMNYFADPVPVPAVVAATAPPVPVPLVTPAVIVPPPVSPPESAAVPVAETVPPVQALESPEGQVQAEPEVPAEVTEADVLAVAPQEEPNKAKIVWETYKALGDLEKPVEEGGIGHRPTPEQVIEYYRDSLSHRMMLNDVLSATEQGIDGFFYAVEKMQPGVATKIFAQLPSYLAKVSSPAQPDSPYNVMKNHFMDEAIGTIHGKLNELERPEDKQVVETVVRALYFLRYGKQFDPKVGVTPQENPEVKRLREENERIRNGQFQQVSGAWQGSVMQTVHSELFGLASNALGALKDRLAPAAFSSTAQALEQSLLNRVLKDQFVTETIKTQMRSADIAMRNNDFVGAGRIKESLVQFVKGKAVTLAGQEAKAFLPQVKPVAKVPGVAVPVAQVQQTQPPRLAPQAQQPVQRQAPLKGTEQRLNDYWGDVERSIGA